MKCDWVVSRMDAYLDGEPGEEVAEMERHLAVCEECAGRAQGRRELRARMRDAAAQVPVPAELLAQVRMRLDGERRGFVWTRTMVAAAAIVVLAAGVGVWKAGHRGVEREDELMGRVMSHTAPILRVGLQDHVHCAMYGSHEANGPTLEAMTAALGPQFAGLLEVVRETVPGGLRVVEAHQCIARGRRYVHVVAREGDRLVSLVITRRAEGEAFERDVKAVVGASGVPMYAGGADELDIAGFETAKHLVFVVSNLGSAKNLAALRALTPGVSEVLRTAEI